MTKNLDLKLWIWWFVYDVKGSGMDFAPYFQELGILNRDGAPKPAAEAWKNVGK